MTITRDQGVATTTSTTATAFIGIGNMGEAIMAGALKGGLDPQRVHATARRRHHVERIATQYGVTGGTDNREAVTTAELVVVGVEPEQVAGVLDEIADALPSTAVVVSLAARVTTQELEAHLRQGSAVVRVMPNTPAQVGEGLAVLTPGLNCSEEQLQKVRDFFSLSGEVIVVPEEQQRAVGALSGTGPAHFFYVVDAMIEAGVAMGLRRDMARSVVVQTIVGAGALLRESGEHPVVLRERVTSPGGNTVAAMGELDERAVRAAFVSAMTGRFRR
ncbi:pyrroline-5-carboxylate reductase [Sinomonas mesophila]|uniref:pyrroline-5-carboxylate reductase n=1 Tax=Sinomonas mesophila TaxID=1531955 RepID=UPI000984F551|nr:pyrroline-5-carboxylate reductase [Sinomonas mesophila]